MFEVTQAHTVITKILSGSSKMDEFIDEMG